MRHILLVAGSLFLSLLIFCLVLWQWQQYGVVAEQKNEIFAVPERESALPRIYAVNRRVGQGERIPLSRLARASDVDGRDLSEKVQCYAENGEMLSGVLDTDTPGQYILTWKVQSAITGKRIQKKTIILVDGRVDS